MPVTAVSRPDPVQVLPEELLLKIFSYLRGRDLCQAALVSRQWSTLVGTPWLWRKVNIIINTQSKICSWLLVTVVCDDVF